MPEQYRVGERVSVTVHGLVINQSESDRRPAELTIALDPPAELYDVTVPLNQVTVERLVPAEGEPQPGEIWQDKIGRDLFAYVGRYDQVFLLGATGSAGGGESWLSVHQQHGPLTRVYPKPATPDAEPPVEQAPATPELHLGDKWQDDEGDVWSVIDDHIDGLILKCTSAPLTLSWDGANDGYGPLTRVHSAPAVPELRVGDVWKDCVGDPWHVVNDNGATLLAMHNNGAAFTAMHGDGLPRTWETVNEQYGPLVRVEQPESGAV